MNIERQRLEAFAAAARQAAALGLTRCSSGNLSERVDGDTFLIKVSRAWMAELTPEDIALCRLSDATALDGKTPSVEINFHAGILRTRPDVQVVLHFQTPAATTLCCCPTQVNYQVIPEIPFYIGAVGTVPYLTPGSQDLAAAVTAAMQSHDLVQMQNHGQVVVGRSHDEAIQKAMFFEFACDVILRGQGNVRPLPDHVCESLRAGYSASALRRSG